MMNTFIFCILFTILFMSSLWLIDISVAGMMNNIMLKGMFFEADPYFTYHLGLYLATVCFFIVIAFIFYLKLEEYRKEIQNYFKK